MMKLLRMDTDSFPMLDMEREAYKRAGVDEVVSIGGYDAESVVEADPDAICVVGGYLPGKVLRRLTRCRFIMRMGTGYDKIDIPAASERGILVAYVKSYCSREVAEHAMAMLLAAARKLPELSRSFARGDYMTVRPTARIHRVKGAVLGIIGFGRIGQELGEMAHGLGMRVLAFDAYHGAKVDYPFEYVEMDALLREADYVSVNCPLIPETRGLIGEKELDLMKPTAVLINCARGAICDEAAVVAALKSGQIAYACMDVHEHVNIFEPPVGAPMGLYTDVPNLLASPHCAHMSAEAWRDCVMISAERVRAFCEGRVPEDCVNAAEAKGAKA